MRAAKLAVAVACVAAAALIAWRSGFGAAAEPLSDAAASQTQWLCRACGHAFRLTARQAHDAAVRAGLTDRYMPIHCEKCGAQDAWRAARCRKDGTLYFVKDVPGSTGRCPECFPVPASQRRVTPDEGSSIGGKPERQVVPNL